MEVDDPMPEETPEDGIAATDAVVAPGGNSGERQGVGPSQAHKGKNGGEDVPEGTVKGVVAEGGAPIPSTEGVLVYESTDEVTQRALPA